MCLCASKKNAKKNHVKDCGTVHSCHDFKVPDGLRQELYDYAENMLGFLILFVCVCVQNFFFCKVYRLFFTPHTEQKHTHKTQQQTHKGNLTWLESQSLIYPTRLNQSVYATGPLLKISYQTMKQQIQIK